MSADLKNYNAETRDALILARAAVEALTDGGLSKITLEMNLRGSLIRVEARK